MNSRVWKVRPLEVDLPKCAIRGQYGVYVAFDENDDVLYVGRTKDLYQRLYAGHRSQSAWYPQMRRIEFIPCDGATEARVLEKETIARLRPAVNVFLYHLSESSRQVLPDWTVAQLVSMHEASEEAIPHNEAEDARLNNYVLALNREGWHLATIGAALSMTRQAVSKRKLRATEADCSPDVPSLAARVLERAA